MQVTIAVNALEKRYGRTDAVELEAADRRVGTHSVGEAKLGTIASSGALT